MAVQGGLVPGHYAPDSCAGSRCQQGKSLQDHNTDAAVEHSRKQWQQMLLARLQELRYMLHDVELLAPCLQEEAPAAGGAAACHQPQQQCQWP